MATGFIVFFCGVLFYALCMWWVKGRTLYSVGLVLVLGVGTDSAIAGGLCDILVYDPDRNDGYAFEGYSVPLLTIGDGQMAGSGTGVFSQQGGQGGQGHAFHVYVFANSFGETWARFDFGDGSWPTGLSVPLQSGHVLFYQNYAITYMLQVQDTPLKRVAIYTDTGLDFAGATTQPYGSGEPTSQPSGTAPTTQHWVTDASQKLTGFHGSGTLESARDGNEYSILWKAVQEGENRVPKGLQREATTQDSTGMFPFLHLNGVLGGDADGEAALSISAATANSAWVAICNYFVPDSANSGSFPGAHDPTQAGFGFGVLGVDGPGGMMQMFTSAVETWAGAYPTLWAFSQLMGDAGLGLIAAMFCYRRLAWGLGWKAADAIAPPAIGGLASDAAGERGVEKDL